MSLRRSITSLADMFLQSSKLEFERKFCVFGGTLLRWFDGDVPGMPPRGQISLLSVSLIKRLDPDDVLTVPSNAFPGFSLRDVSRPTIYILGTSQAQADGWLKRLEHIRHWATRPPLTDLGPVQASFEKPIISGQLLVRDVSPAGFYLDTFSWRTVSLFDSRFEIYLHDRLVELKYFTLDFLVGDSRVRPDSFVLTNTQITYYFAAQDWQAKRFWMQTLAKALMNLKSMFEHAANIRKLKLGGATPRKKNGDLESDDDDDDDEDEKYDDDARRPPQVRRESLRRFYVEGINPYDETDLPNLNNVKRKSGIHKRGMVCVFNLVFFKRKRLGTQVVEN